MHSLLRVSLLLASLLSVLAHDQPRVRKSLGFGPVLPHAVFKSSPYQIQVNNFSPQSPDADPLEIARLFVEDLLFGRLSQDSTFVIRGDSYTDAATGVSHVYARQLINGIEVADGDINLNIKDGVVLSYGDSFYRGSVPAPFVNPATAADVSNLHEVYCTALHEQVKSSRLVFNGDSQTVFKPSTAGDTVNPVVQPLYDANCAQLALPHVLHSSLEDIADPREALLQFMIAATPKQDVADDILSRYETHVLSMTSTFTHRLVGSYESLVEMIENVPDAIAPVKTTIAYVQVPHGEETVLSLVWKFEVQMEDNWYEAAVSATSPHTIVSVVDWASDAYAPIPLPIPEEPVRKLATYNVLTWGINDPSEANRSILKEKVDLLASPFGWHTFPASLDPRSVSKSANKKDLVNSTTTFGNNVFAHENWEGLSNWVDNYRPDAGESLVFNYSYNPEKGDTSEQIQAAKKYINASVTQLFYSANLVHDLFYRYGFDELSGNFQQYNFERGGEGDDAVIANAQDGSGLNNANFMTPPDGQHGICRMYLWNTANPFRDGDLEAGVVIHELSHGLSTRLTGGPANSGCLGWGESGGMGEGWGDFLATTIRSTKNYSDYPLGAWVANRPNGIRNYPYSLNDTVNPSTYKTLDKPGYWGVHAIGEVWAEILWIVSQRLITKHGYSESLFPPAPLENGTIPEGDFYRPAEYTLAGSRKPLVPKHGNSLIVQLVLDGMKLQACRPSFFDARDAIIQADQILTGGENYCELWEGFAERGLGPDARVEGRTPWGGGIRTNDFDLPLTCRQSKVPPPPETPPPETPGDGDDDDDDEEDDEPEWLLV